MRFVFDVSGDRQVSRKLLRIGSYAGDARPVFSVIAGVIMDENQKQFDTQGAHASGGWKPLDPKTLAAKQRKGQDLRVLHATLALERSLTRRGDPNQLLELGRQDMRLASTLPYAGAHQNPRPTNALPQRRPIEFTEGARRDIVKRLQRYILTGEVA